MSIIFCNGRKKALKKNHAVSTRQKISFHEPNSLKNMFSLDGKTTFGGRNM